MALYSETPRVPLDYPRLSALSQQELSEAIRNGYVTVSPSAKPTTSEWQEVGSDNIGDWRMRMYVLWFCYIYENFFAIQRPIRVIEDLFLEFKSNILNGGKTWGLAQAYAGAGAWNPSQQELIEAHVELRVYYDNAVGLLKDWLVKG